MQTPEQYLYMQARKAKRARKQTSETMNIFMFNDMYKKYMQEQMYKLFAETCKAAKQIAIHSQKLTKRMRIKYADHCVFIGRNTFYVFPQDAIPHDIYYKVLQQIS